MKKLFLLASLSATLATAGQLVVHAAPHPTRIPGTGRIVKMRQQRAADDQAGDSSLVIGAPVSGYVADIDNRGVRPILGFRTFSFIGDTFDFGEDLASIVSSPNQNYVVEIAATGMASLWTDVGGGLGQIAFPGDVSATSAVIPSALGFSVAVVSRDRGVVQVYGSLPNNPVLTFSVSFADLGGTPGPLAVSDDGGTLLYAARNGERQSLYALGKGKQRQLVHYGGISSAAFAPNALDAVATDARANQVYLLHNTNGLYVSWLLADQGAGISYPVAAQFSRDGQQIVVANARARNILTFGVDGTPGSATPCGCAASTLTRLIGNAVFQLTGFDGLSMAIFDGDSQPAAAVWISPLAQPDGDPEDPSGRTPGAVGHQ